MWRLVVKYLSGINQVHIPGTVSLDIIYADSEPSGDGRQRVARSYDVRATCGGGGGAASVVACPISGVYDRRVPARNGNVPPILPEHTYILSSLDDDTTGSRCTGLRLGHGSRRGLRFGQSRAVLTCRPMP